MPRNRGQCPSVGEELGGGVLIGRNPIKGKSIFLAVIEGFHKKRLELIASRFFLVHLINNVQVVAKNLEGAFGEILLIRIDELKQGQEGGVFRMEFIHRREWGFEDYADFGDGKSNHGGLVDLTGRRKPTGGEIALHVDCKGNLCALWIMAGPR
jgi:hypothetical protein